MNQKTKYALLITLVALGIYLTLRLGFGIFTSYNAFTAKRDIKNGVVKIITIGEPDLTSARQDLAKQYGFGYSFVGCNSTIELRNGSRFYNAVVEEYLIEKYGKDFWSRFNAQVQKEIQSENTMTARSKIKQIVFGIYCGECGEHCATMYRYSVDSNLFAADLTDAYFNDPASIRFNTPLNDQFHLGIGSDILANIPDTLLNEPLPYKRYGCPDCGDGCGIYFEISRAGQKQQLFIDHQTEALGGQIKIFAEYMNGRIKELRKR